MRRVLLVCLMLLLPWQGAWAGMPQACGGGACPSQGPAAPALPPVAVVLAQAVDVSHRAAAESHRGEAHPAAASPQTQSDETPSRCTGDCGMCKLHLQPALPSRAAPVPLLAAEAGGGVYRSAIADALVERLLRPPSRCIWPPA